MLAALPILRLVLAAPVAPMAVVAPAQLVALCNDLRSAPGPASKRKAALASEWGVRLPPGQFPVAVGDGRDGSLTLSLHGGFRLFDGKVLLTSVDDDDLELALPPGQPQPTHLEALTLELVFRPGRAEEPACTLGLTAEVALSVELLQVKLLDRAGHTVAYLDSEVLNDRPKPPGGTPEVTVDSAQVEGGAASSDRLTEALQGLRPELLGCFQHALAATPTLDGVLVLGFALGKDGHPGSITVVADSVQDEAMATCVTEKVGRLAVKKGKKGGAEPAGKASATLRFERH